MNLIQLYEIGREDTIISILWMNKLWLRKVKQLAQYPTLNNLLFLLKKILNVRILQEKVQGFDILTCNSVHCMVMGEAMLKRYFNFWGNGSLLMIF